MKAAVIARSRCEISEGQGWLAPFELKCQAPMKQKTEIWPEEDLGER